MPRHVLADVLLWVVLAAPTVAWGEVPPHATWTEADLRLLAPPTLAVAVLVARRWPATALLAPVVLNLVAIGSMYGEQLLVAQVVLAFLLGRRTTGGNALARLGVVLAVIAAVFALVTAVGEAEPDWLELASSTLLQIVVPWTAGRVVERQEALVRAGWELASRLEQERERAVAAERARERARIARDMHDSLGHELSLLAVQAAALQVAAGADTATHDAAATLRATAADATERLRQIVGVLREENEPQPVSPATLDLRADLAALVERARASGLDAAFQGTVPGGRTAHGGTTDQTTAAAGEPTAARADIPSEAARAAHRVVQEALTNAARHAPGSPVRVMLAADGDELLVRVRNPTPPRTPAAPAEPASGGYGLVGLDERVRLAGGNLTVDDGDPFVVTARLPLAPRTPPTIGNADGPSDDGPARPTTPAATPPVVDHARRTLRRDMVDVLWVPLTGVVAVLTAYVLSGGA